MDEFLTEFLTGLDDFPEIVSAARRDGRAAPCDDDPETTCPYIGMCPDESGDSSPLRFR